MATTNGQSRKTYAIPVPADSGGTKSNVPLRFSRQQFNRAFLEPQPGSEVPPSLLLFPKNLKLDLDAWAKEHPGVILGADLDACSLCVCDESVTGFGGGIKHGAQEPLARLFDPENKLAELWDCDEIRLIQGNCSLKTAHVVLVSDDAHYDEAHALLQGKIANCVKGERNVVLLEGIDAGGANNHEIPQMLVRNFAPGASDDVRGWDDTYFYNKSKNFVQQTVFSQETMDILFRVFEDPRAFDEVDEATAKKVNRALEENVVSHESWNYVKNEGCRVRNEALVATVVGQLHNVDYRIIVFGGSLHVRDATVLRALAAKTQFVCVTARRSEAADACLRWSGLKQQVKRINSYYDKK